MLVLPDKRQLCHMFFFYFLAPIFLLYSADVFVRTAGYFFLLEFISVSDNRFRHIHRSDVIDDLGYYPLYGVLFQNLYIFFENAIKCERLINEIDISWQQTFWLLGISVLSIFADQSPKNE